jgi:8-oxo-dGTP diphosphatase
VLVGAFSTGPAARSSRRVRDHRLVTAVGVPQLPASAGALISDASGQLLILKTTYKKGWSLPGGQIEPGESPWEACRRETLEECGLRVAHARLVCVDFLRPRLDRAGGLRLLFDCGTLRDDQLAAIRLQPDEIDEFRLAPISLAIELLTGPVGRRVAASVGAEGCVYLEDGRTVDAVG